MQSSQPTSKELTVKATANKTTQMADFQILPFDFNDTTVTFVANNKAAQDRIYGGKSVEIRKSESQRFYATLIGDGFKVNVQ